VLRIVLNRLALAIPLVIVVTFLAFFLVSIGPTDIAATILQGDASPQAVAELRQQLGLDQPLYAQYGNWLISVVQGDLGSSALTHQPVGELLSQRMGVTISLFIGVLIVVSIFGIGLGVISAVRGGWLGRTIDVLSLGGLVFPSFWLALILIAIFAVQLRWLPATGFIKFTDDPWMWFLCIVLPVTSASVAAITSVAKQTRDSMSDAMSRDYIRSLRASGLSTNSIIYKHALRNASLPVVTVLGLVMISAVTTVIYVERILVLPGVAGLAVDGAIKADLPVLMGCLLVFTLITVGISLLVDLSYAWLNPKVRLS
jgi:peptide/nickel transport system permease protein